MSQRFDSHIHLLPGMDTGPFDIDEACDMLESLRSAGIGCVLACPSFSPEKDTVRTFICKRSAALHKLRQLSKIKILPAVELSYFPGFSKTEDLGELITPRFGYLPISLLPGRYDDDIVKELAYLIQIKRLKLMILHCERYTVFMNQQSLDRLFSLPCTIFQFSLRSLCNPNIASLALSLHRKGNTVVLGSNAHDKSMIKYESQALGIFDGISKIAYDVLTKATDSLFESHLIK